MVEEGDMSNRHEKKKLPAWLEGGPQIVCS